MLTITVPGPELYDEASEKFITEGDVVLELEHSLVSLSKWEAIVEKPFLSGVEMSTAEVMAYIQVMTLTPNVPQEVFGRLSTGNMADINAYINKRMSATWFNALPTRSGSREVVTSELVYYWMTVFTIPLEAQNWHLNRLFTLIQIADVKSQKPKKMGRNEQAQRQRELNERRKAQLGTSG